MYEGVRCSVVNLLVNIIIFIGSELNLDLLNFMIVVIGFMNILYGMFVLVLEGKFVEYFFKYDKLFFLDFSGKNCFGVELVKYCKKNDVIIKIEIIDEKVNIGFG